MDISVHHETGAPLDWDISVANMIPVTLHGNKLQTPSSLAHDTLTCPQQQLTEPVLGDRRPLSRHCLSGDGTRPALSPAWELRLQVCRLSSAVCRPALGRLSGGGGGAGSGSACRVRRAAQRPAAWRLTGPAECGPTAPAAAAPAARRPPADRQVHTTQARRPLQWHNTTIHSNIPH